MEENRLQFEINISRNILIQDVNHDLLFQLFYNLLNNAIRYNRPGGAIQVSDRVDSRGMYVVDISDTGVGISPTDLNLIFDRFKKVGNKNSEAFGLGLSIVKSISGYLGLQISASSSQGVGTTFSVAFPKGLQAQV
jgi:two-component system sensor histidine kinase ArlS